MRLLAPAAFLLSIVLTVAPSARADGQRDFAWEIGTWKTHVSRLAQPLSGSKEWLEYDGTSIVRSLVGGQSNLVELDIAGPAGKIQGVSLRLYDPQARTWALHYASLRNGALTAPVIGGFKNGEGEFFGTDTLGERAIKVRFRIACPTPDRCEFRQAYSGDGGHTWEENWMATDIRVADEPAAPKNQ